jgi:hypothetical protein
LHRLVIDPAERLSSTWPLPQATGQAAQTLSTAAASHIWHCGIERVSMDQALISPYVMLAAATVGKAISRKALDTLARSSLNGISTALNQRFQGDREVINGPTMYRIEYKLRQQLHTST